MDKAEKDTVDRAKDAQMQGADDLLRQLRERFESDDQPEDIFDADGALPDGDVEDEQDEELARRIMEMFSSTQTMAPTPPVSEEQDMPVESEVVVDEETEVTVEAESEAETAPTNQAEPEEIEATELTPEEQESPQSAEKSDEEELADQGASGEASAEHFEDEVSDTALPDYDDALEDEQPAQPAAVMAPVEAVVTEEAQEETAAVAEPDEPDELDEPTEPDELPMDDAAEEPLPSEPVAESEGHQAALPLEESAPMQESTDPDAQEEKDGEDEENIDPVAEPILLRDDEMLLDEYDLLPGEDAPHGEDTPEAVHLHMEASVERSEVQPKQIAPRPSPLDAALSIQRKKQQAEGGSRLSTQLRAAQNLSEEDLALLLRLGYENELSSKRDAQTLQRIERESATEPLTDRQKAHLAYGWHEDDHTHTPAQRDAQIRETYRKQASAMTARLIFGTLFAVLVLLWDLSPLYVHLLPDKWASWAQHPVAHFVALQLLVFCAVVSGRRLIYGLRQLLRMTPEPSSVLAPLLLCNAAYDIIMSLQPTQYALLNFPTAMLCLLGIVADAMDLRRERITFSVVSANETKIVPIETAPPKKKVVRGGRIVKIINDEADRSHYSVERVAQLQDYFYRTNAPTARYRAIFPMLALQMLLSLGVAGLCTIKTGVTPQALSVLMLSLQLTAPAAAVFVYAYALLTACRRLQSKNATIVGQCTVDEMAVRKQIVFADTEMLQAKSSTEILVKGSGDPKRYVRYARRLFYALGGTLAKINTSDLSEDRMDGLVEILRVYPDGVEARMDGRVRVLAGSSDFMVKNGIRVPHTNAEMLARRNDESSILYLAFGGQIRLGYEINYRIHGSFEQLAATLAQGKTAVAIRSYDPNITEEYLADSRTGKKTPVRVIKPVRHRKSEVRDIAPGGIVATEHVRGVAYAVRMCEHIKENHALFVGVQLVMAVIGAAIAAAIAWLSLLEAGIGVMAALVLAVLTLPSLMITGRNLWIDTAVPTEKAQPMAQQPKDVSQNKK